MSHLELTAEEARPSPAPSIRPPFLAHQIILKVASRCNLFCDYCHWFRDPNVYSQPKLMSEEIEDAFLARLGNYLSSSPVDDTALVFHGGEPLLFPKHRYESFVAKVRRLEGASRRRLRLAMTTNGTLIDREWAQLLRSLGVVPCVSLDGTRAMHDAHRVSLMGRGSHAEVVGGLQLLRDAGFDPHILTVCNVDSSPDELCDYFVNTLRVRNFDVLTPNFTVDDGRQGLVKPIAAYYNRLFDLWYDVYAAQGVEIRYLRSLAKVVLGAHSGIQGLGLNASLAHVVIQPDGTIEPHDVLRIGGNHLVRTNCNVLTNELVDVTRDPVWLSAFDAAQRPPGTCLQCPYYYACGSGEVMHRFSSDRGYDNPTIYCGDMKQIIGHVWQRISADLYHAADGTGASAAAGQGGAP